MKKVEVLIVGSGKLASELLTNINSDSVAGVHPWDKRDRDAQKPFIVVHAGSGRELSDVVTFCAQTGSVLLELSTGESELPDHPNFPIIICPNVNSQMLYFMAMVKYAARFFKGQDISISESHQASKTTKPGTAIYMANSLGIPESKISSERDPAIQSKTIGIPDPFLDRHAYHQIKIADEEVEIKLETRVLGKAAYASGLTKIIDTITRKTLTSGRHDIVDIITDGL